MTWNLIKSSETSGNDQAFVHVSRLKLSRGLLQASRNKISQRGRRALSSQADTVRSPSSLHVPQVQTEDEAIGTESREEHGDLRYKSEKHVESFCLLSCSAC